MRIAVLVKQVAVLDDELELLDDGRGVDPDCAELEVNEWDAFALEAALILRDSMAEGSHEVLVVTMGDERAEECVRSCLAKGADRGIRIWDDALAEADVLAVARVLAATLAGEAVDLILCGAQSSDEASGATGSAVAGFLELAHVAVVKQIGFDGSVLTVSRELEGRVAEVVTLEPPALLTVQTGIAPLRHATLREIKRAREKPLEVKGLLDVGLDASTVAGVAGSRLVSLTHPETGERAQMLGGDSHAVAARILEIVHDRMAG
jgi:electron transfer flavoprotein beta subunit